MTYEVIGTPRIEDQYCDNYETTMVIDLQREDGEIGDVWIVAGVPDYQQGTAQACGGPGRYPNHLESVRVYGDSPDTWCPDVFRIRDLDGNYSTVATDVVAACEATALQAHRQRLADAAEVREFVEAHEDDDEFDDAEMDRIFEIAYGRVPKPRDRADGLWSLICAAAGVE